MKLNRPEQVHTMNKVNRGITLIELMIVILLMSIVLGLSIPSYRDYTLRAGRTDATNALLRVAAAQERFYLQNGTYADDAALAINPPNGLGFTDAKSQYRYYNLHITSDPSEDALTVGYTATATVDAAGKQKGDSNCPSLSINQNSRRGANGGYEVDVVEACWR